MITAAGPGNTQKGRGGTEPGRVATVRLPGENREGRRLRGARAGAVQPGQVVEPPQLPPGPARGRAAGRGATAGPPGVGAGRTPRGAQPRLRLQRSAAPG